MKDLQQVIMQKASAADGGTIVAGGLFVTLSEKLPIVVGVLTAILFLWRIACATQEFRINRLKRKLLEAEIEKELS